MTTLLDVNVLAALAWPNHTHHTQAVDWFKLNHELGWATCPLTESGFARVSSNPKIIPDARTPASCIELLEKMRELSGHEFWSDATTIVNMPVSRKRILRRRQITDAHLLAMVLEYDGRLATFDRGIANLLTGKQAKRYIEHL